MAQGTLAFDNDDVGILRFNSLDDLMFNLTGLKTRAQDIHRDAVLGALKQTGLTGCHERGRQSSPPKCFYEENCGGPFTNRAICPKNRNHWSRDPEDRSREDVQVFSRWWFPDIVDLHTMFPCLLDELVIFGEELRKPVDDVHALFHGREHRLSLLPREVRCEWCNAVDEVLRNKTELLDGILGILAL